MKHQFSVWEVSLADMCAILKINTPDSEEMIPVTSVSQYKMWLQTRVHCSGCNQFYFVNIKYFTVVIWRSCVIHCSAHGGRRTHRQTRQRGTIWVWPADFLVILWPEALTQQGCRGGTVVKASWINITRKCWKVCICSKPIRSTALCTSCHYPQKAFYNR